VLTRRFRRWGFSIEGTPHFGQQRANFRMAENHRPTGSNDRIGLCREVSFTSAKFRITGNVPALTLDFEEAI
jgi:hypothetical protein